ncbi:MAG: hypothetical protein GKR89_35690 [Candidatus Latescibacteria bacterium]|nr:hypothetical protein [Candidatus Latescibacterota bacterium]
MLAVQLAKPPVRQGKNMIEAYTCEDPIGAFMAAGMGLRYDPSCDPDYHLVPTPPDTTAAPVDSVAYRSGAVESAALQVGDLYGLTAAMRSGATFSKYVIDSLAGTAAGTAIESGVNWVADQFEDDDDG